MGSSQGGLACVDRRTARAVTIVACTAIFCQNSAHTRLRQLNQNRSSAEAHRRSHRSVRAGSAACTPPASGPGVAERITVDRSPWSAECPVSLSCFVRATVRRVIQISKFSIIIIKSSLTIKRNWPPGFWSKGCPEESRAFCPCCARLRLSGFGTRESSQLVVRPGSSVSRYSPSSIWYWLELPLSSDCRSSLLVSDLRKGSEP